MDKTFLDNIIEKHKAQPVGHSYIDIIVSRDNYKDFISDLVTNGFKIDSISWWEWRTDKNESEYGLGGPKSIYFPGYFFEIPIDIDDINFPSNETVENIITDIQKRIETKTISFSDEKVTFINNNWLTPAIWLDVADDWRNKYSA